MNVVELLLHQTRITATEAWEETVDPLDDGGEEKGTAEPAAGDGVQQPRQQKPEDLFLEKCEQFRIELAGMLRTRLFPALSSPERRPLDTEACRQRMQEWWNAEMLTNSGFQWTRDKDEQEQSEQEAKGGKGSKGGEGREGGKGSKGGKGGKGGSGRAVEGLLSTSDP